MSRFFFHIFDGTTDTFDKDGVECEGIREVRLHMLHVAMRETESSDVQKENWAIEALNDRGVIVGSMDFGLLSATEYRR